MMTGSIGQHAEAGGGAPDVVIVNAKVYTGDATRPEAEAVAIRGERIARVGSTGEIRALADGETRVIDAGGRRVVPGFNDAHVHLLGGAEELVGVNLRPADSAEDLVRRLGAYVAGEPRGRWITGGYWDNQRWPGAGLPDRWMLDAVSPAHPVFAQRLDGHMAVANSLALQRAGITRLTAAPAGGAIVHDATGEPTGLLKDNAMGLVLRVIPDDPFARTIEKARAALAHAASLGVTSLQDMTASADELRAYQALRAAGELTARISSIQNHGIGGLCEAGIGTGFGDDWLRIGGLKLFADGSMGSGTAAFFDPYTDDPSTCGLLIHEPDALERAMFDGDAAGFQLVVHAIGDRANALVLDILEKLVRERGPRDRRPRIEHAQVVRPADRPRFGSLGVIASIQPSHCIDDMRWAADRIGAGRARHAYNVRSFAEAGARLAFGTDWFVEPLDPMLGIYAAVTRQFPDGTPAGGWYPDERITVEQAVACYTMGSAHAEFAEARKGSITEGRLADLVVLTRDIFTVPPRDILGTRPSMTMAGGRVVFEAHG